MSIFKKMISNYNVRKQERNERRADEQYINKDLTSNLKNAYYKMCGNCDVFLRNPQKYDIANSKLIYLETNNIPTYIIRFTTSEKANDFIQNNFFMGVGHQTSVEINQVGANVIIKPIRFDYGVHIEVDNEEVAQKLVIMFRRQYIDNKNLAKLKGQEEIENLGIEF